MATRLKYGLLLPIILAFPTQGVAATLSVENTSDLVNGDTSSPQALVANSGPDGISLREAILAANEIAGPHVVEFEPVLSGATVVLTGSLPILDRDRVTLDADVDGDGQPEITLDGGATGDENAFFVFASDIEIRGFVMQNFSHSGVKIFNDSFSGRTVIERVTLASNHFRNSPAAVDLYNWGSLCSIRNILIEHNEFHDNTSGAVGIAAALGQLQNDNEIVDVMIRDNVFVDGGATSAIFAKGASDRSSERNLLSGLAIEGNTISGHTNGAVLVSAGNEAHDQDNRVEGLRISGNWIEASPVAIEIVAGVGFDASGNTVSGTEITWNTLIDGGIQLATAWDNAHHNSIVDVLMAWNRIYDCVANGFHLSAGAGGAHDSLLSELALRNNLIVGCTDGAGILLHGEDGLTPDNTVDDVEITNNTIVGNGNPAWAGGININSKHASNVITGVEIRNSILWDNAGSDAIRGSLAPALVHNTILNDGRFVGLDGNFYASPDFVDPSTSQYRLKPGSPAIDQGDLLWTDLDAMDLGGNQRQWDGDGLGGEEVDLGAYEAGSPEDRILSGIVVDDALEAAGCRSITVTGVAVQSPGSLILWTGGAVALGDGVGVGAGAELRVVSKPFFACS